MDYKELEEIARKVLIEKYDYGKNEDNESADEVFRVAASVAIDVLWEYHQRINNK